MRPNHLTEAFFNERTVVHPATQCWEMRTNLGRKGYARPMFNGRRQFAHRASYELFVGTIPEGLCVCHRCDNPSCVNPKHLFLGTRADNNADRDAKKRTVTPSCPIEKYARGASHGSRTKPESVSRGERHGMSKLTERDAMTALELLRCGWPQQMIARRLGVLQTSISNLKHGVTWKHLPRPSEAA